jgi:hypothetical protein
MRRGLRLVLAAVAALWTAAAAAQPLPLDVTFRLTDLDYKPVAGAAVRIVFGSDPDWQAPNAGRRFVTDANGEHRFTASVVIDKRSRKRPTNFADSLLSRPQATDHLKVGTELEYAGFRWLYVVDVDRFPNSDVMLDDFSVFSADSQGRYVRKAKQQGRDWLMADLGGLALTGPGHEPWNFMLKPQDGDATAKRWTLVLAFKRAPEPVRR